MSREIFQGNFRINEENQFKVGLPILYNTWKEIANPQEDYIGGWDRDSDGFDRSVHDMNQLRLRLKEEGKL